MHLPRASCILCSEHIRHIKYNLKTTYSEKSNVLLIKFVEHIYQNVFLMHCNICTACYNLINEIDTIQLREKELYDQLKSYILKVDNASLPVKIEEIRHDDQNVLGNISELVDSVNLKKLPIKIRKIASDEQTEKKSNKKNCNNTHNGNSDDKAAFEKVQSLIQMELTKHEVHRKNRNKVCKSVLCDICGQSFRTKLGFQNHLKHHDKGNEDLNTLPLRESYWVCNICQKIFTQKVSLSRHMFIHSGESRYQCEQCGKKFIHHSSFNIHKKIHSGQRNFKCTVCSKNFLTGSHLKRHVRATHTLEKVYGCEICGKKFAENYNLIAHLKTHKLESDAFVL